MVDKLIVQLQDTSTALRNSKDETVKIGLRDARRCINDADKLKQVRNKMWRKYIYNKKKYFKNTSTIKKKYLKNTFTINKMF